MGYQMASRPLIPGVNAFNLTTVFQEIFKVESPAIRAGIDAAIFNNYAKLPDITYTIRLIQPGDTPGQLNEVITDKIIRAGANDLAAAMIGQALDLDGTIEAKASANNAVSATITVTLIDS